MMKATGQNENATPNIKDALFLPRRGGQVTALTRAVGEPGQLGYIYRNKPCIGYAGCPCGLLVFFPLKIIEDTQRMQAHMCNHETLKQHTDGIKQKEQAFAASLGRLNLDNAGDVEIDRGSAMPRAFSQMGDEPPSTCRPAGRRATAASAVPAPLAAAATPASLVPGMPATQDANFTLNLDGYSLPDAGRNADVGTMPGFVLYTSVACGASAEVKLGKERQADDRLARLDALILEAPSKGALIVKRPNVIALTAKDRWEDASAKPLAIKIFYDNEDATLDFKDEEEVFRTLAKRGVSSEFIVQCFGASMTAAGQGALILQYGAGGSLKSLLDMMEERGIKLGEPSALILAAQIFSGVAALHEADVSHRDVKLENVIVCLGTEETLQLLERFAVDPFLHGATERALIKICDFALARVGPSHIFAGNGGDEALGAPQGTVEYLAPEMFAAERYDAMAADVFAAGVCFQRLLSGGVAGASPAAERLLAKLIEPDVSLRMSATEAAKIAKHLVFGEAGVPGATAATPLRLAGMSGFTPAAQPARGSSSRASRSRNAASHIPADLMSFTPIAEAPGDAEA